MVGIWAGGGLVASVQADQLSPKFKCHDELAKDHPHAAITLFSTGTAM